MRYILANFCLNSPTHTPRGSCLRPVNEAPPEPDQAPHLATLDQLQADTRAYSPRPAARPDDKNARMPFDLYATQQPSSGYAASNAPSSPSPSPYAHASRPSPYAPNDPAPAGAASPKPAVVVVSNFPRQQVASVLCVCVCERERDSARERDRARERQRASSDMQSFFFSRCNHIINIKRKFLFPVK